MVREQISFLSGTFHLLKGVLKQRSSRHTDLYVLRPGQLLGKREGNVNTVLENQPNQMRQIAEVH